MSAALLCAALASCQATPTRVPTTEGPASSAAANKQTLEDSAKDVYRRYLLAVQQISEDGNTGFASLRPLLTGKAYKNEVAAFEDLKTRGLRTQGAARLIKFQTQTASSELKRVVAYACVDLSRVRVRSQAGKDVTPSSRPNRQTSLATFVTVNGSMRLDENGTWSGESIC
jgi:hypothetical protein